MNNATKYALASVMVLLCATMEATPLVLDVSSLTNAWNEARISSYQCRSAFRDFGKAIADANAEAVTRRAKLDTTARVYLKQQMEKAQAEGDLDKVLVFKEALESARAGEISGDDEAIVKLRESYEKQLVLADKALLAAGLTAARALTGTLEWQKTETTKNGGITDAQKIVSFQKKVEGWAKSMQTKAAETVTAQAAVAQPTAASRPQQQPRYPVREVKPEEPETKIVSIDASNERGAVIGDVKAGDSIEIQYVSGEWSLYHTMNIESPDAESLENEGKRTAIAMENNPEKVILLLPSGTMTRPYVFVVPEDGRYILRINDANCGDNTGSARYSVKLIPAVASTAVRSSLRPPVGARNRKNAENEGKTAAPASSTAALRVSNLTLSGTQKEMTVTLAKTQTPHVVRDQYVVPNGCELVAEPGANIVFEKGANIYAEGVLKFEGSEKNPIVLRGKASGIGYWHGVIIKQSSESSFEWVQISGATEGLRVIGGTPAIASSVFRENEVGTHIAEYGPHPSFLNCVFTKNRRYGIECHHGCMSLDRCSIVDNGEFGAHVGYSGEVNASSCLVSGNKGGGLRFRDGGHGSFQNSSIIGNKKIDIEAHSKCDFRGNWWGASATRILQQKGDGANLPNIKDGRDEGNGDIVDISDFLTEPPKDCGATVKW
jgi:hypothetical protein